MNKNLLIEAALLNFLQKHLKRRSPTGTIGTAARRALNKLMGRKPKRKLIKRMSFKDFSNDPGAFFDVPVMKEHKMNKLQDLIERIVESKVNALLEADVYQKSARKGGKVVTRMSKKTKPGTSRAEADKKPAENFSKMQKLRNKNKQMNWEKVADYQKRMKKHGTDADRMRHDNVNDPWPSR